MASRPQTDKRERFAQEYAKDFNAAQAAIRSGYAVGSAKVTGCRLLQEPDVQEAVRVILQRVAARNELTIERVTQEVARVAFFDPRRLFDEEGHLKPMSAWDDDTAAAVAAIEGEAGSRKVRAWDKNRALDHAMSILGMHKTSAPSAGGVSIAITMSDGKPL